MRAPFMGDLQARVAEKGVIPLFERCYDGMVSCLVSDGPFCVPPMCILFYSLMISPMIGSHLFRAH